MLYGGGFFVDQFFAGDHEGVVWVHGYGNVFEKMLEPGRRSTSSPAAGSTASTRCQMEQEVYGFKTGHARRRRGQPRVQPVHRAGPGRAAERLLPPAGSETARRRDRRRRAAAKAAGCSAGSSAACSTTEPGDGSLHPATWRASAARPGSSARSASAAISCWPRSPASAPAGSARRHSCSSRPIPIRGSLTPARRSRCTNRGCATSATWRRTPSSRRSSATCGCPATGSRSSAPGCAARSTS